MWDFEKFCCCLYKWGKSNGKQKPSRQGQKICSFFFQQLCYKVNEKYNNEDLQRARRAEFHSNYAELELEHNLLYHYIIKYVSLVFV